MPTNNEPSKTPFSYTNYDQEYPNFRYFDGPLNPDVRAQARNILFRELSDPRSQTTQSEIAFSVLALHESSPDHERFETKCTILSKAVEKSQPFRNLADGVYKKIYKDSVVRRGRQPEGFVLGDDEHTEMETFIQSLGFGFVLLASNSSEPVTRDAAQKLLRNDVDDDASISTDFQAIMDLIRVETRESNDPTRPIRPASDGATAILAALIAKSFTGSGTVLARNTQIARNFIATAAKNPEFVYKEEAASTKSKEQKQSNSSEIDAVQKRIQRLLRQMSREVDLLMLNYLEKALNRLYSVLGDLMGKKIPPTVTP